MIVIGLIAAVVGLMLFFFVVGDVFGYNSDRLIPVALVLLFGGLGLLLTGVIQHENEESTRLMSQCLADGRKEYECVGLLKRNSPHVIVVPQ